MQFLVDGIALTTDGASPFEASWGTTTYSAGPHSLGAEAIDARGNGQSATVTSVNVSNAAVPGPDIDVVRHNDGAIVTDGGSTTMVNEDPFTFTLNGTVLQN